VLKNPWSTTTGWVQRDRQSATGCGGSDYFNSLLMPAPAVVAALQRHGLDFVELTSSFQVSAQALDVRLQILKRLGKI
jgi:hypothetical protein